jgi:hypothetical protein
MEASELYQIDQHREDHQEFHHRIWSKVGACDREWGLERSDKVCVLNRITYCATPLYAAYPRISTKNSKLIQPRKSWDAMGVFCPAETPEGHNVGFVKNMSIGALVTVATDTWRSNGSC